MKNKYLIFSARLLLTCIFVLAVISFVGFNNIWEGIKNAEIKFILIPLLLYFPGQLLSASRWRSSLKGLERDVPFSSLLHHNARGQLSTLFLPGQISGDITRAISVTHNQDEKPKLLFSILIDKFAYFIAVGFFALLGIFGNGGISNLFLIHLSILFLLIVALFIFVFLTSYRNDRITKWLSRHIMKIPFFYKYLGSFYFDSKFPIFSVKTTITILCLGFAFQWLNSIGSYILAKSFEININFIDWVAIIAIVTIAQIFPITIAGLGIREGILVGILTLYQVPVAKIVGYSFLSFFLLTILIIINWLIFEFINSSRQLLTTP